MATGFNADIKPYFTELDRNKMMDSDHTFGVVTFDLWSATDVQNNWDSINDAISNGRMPPAGSPPETDGPWEQSRIDKFVKDFQAWKDGGFQP